MNSSAVLSQKIRKKAKIVGVKMIQLINASGLVNMVRLESLLQRNLKSQISNPKSKIKNQKFRSSLGVQREQQHKQRHDADRDERHVLANPTGLKDSQAEAQRMGRIPHQIDEAVHDSLVELAIPRRHGDSETNQRVQEFVEHKLVDR